MYKLPNFEIQVNPPKPKPDPQPLWFFHLVKASLVQLAKFGTKPDPQPLWFFHLVKASLVKLAKFGNIYHSGHKILLSVLAAFHKAKKPDGLAILVWGLGGFSGT